MKKCRKKFTECFCFRSMCSVAAGIAVTALLIAVFSLFMSSFDIDESVQEYSRCICSLCRQFHGRFYTCKNTPKKRIYCRTSLRCSYLFNSFLCFGFLFWIHCINWTFRKIHYDTSFWSIWRSSRSKHKKIQTLIGLDAYLCVIL